MSEFNKERLLAYMGRRYDYYSARIHFTEALGIASVGDNTAFSQAEVGSICDALEKTGTQQDEMLSSIRIWVGLQEPEPEEETASETASEPVPEAKVEPAPAAKAEPEPESKPEPKVEAKPAPEAKVEPKPEPKPEPTVEARPAPELKAEPAPTPVAKPEPVVQSEITVVVRSVPSSKGQRLVMTGDGEVFGDWDLGKSLVLEADPDGVWRATLTQKVGATLAFKFVLTSDDGAVWEDGDNRQFVVPAEATSAFETEWQVARAA